MKPSHLQTPRNLADTTFVTGYRSAYLEPERVPAWEVAAGYVLALVLGVALAALLFLGLSA